MQHTRAGQAALGTLGPMPDGGEGRFNRVAGPDTLPVLRRKVIKGQQFIAILVQTQRRFRVFRFVSVNEQIKRLVRITLGFPACQIACSACFALGWADFGRQLSTFMVLCIQQRCCRACG